MSDSDSVDSEGATRDVPVAAAAADDDSCAAAPAVLGKVWDGGKFLNLLDGAGNKYMRCTHGECGGTWKGHNHTKALGHVIGGCSDIKPCKYVTTAWKAKYAAIKFGVQKRKQDKLEAIAKMHMGVDALEDRMREQAGWGRASAEPPIRRINAPAAASLSAASHSNIPSSSDEAGPLFLGTRHSYLTPSSRSRPQPHSEATKRALNDVLLDRSGLKKEKKQKFYHQTNLVTSLGKNVASATTDLDLAISHLIHGCGLPFSLVEDPLFHQLLVRARDVNANYSAPTRTDIAGPLLDLTFKAYYDDAKERLLKEAKMYGITVGGDGATIDKCPLFNAIACSVSNPSMVLDVFDCSQHAAEGGKKDAEYLVKTMLPKLKEIDPHRELIDLITFDGAGNVQNAAKLLTLHFPRASVGPAIEHVVSLVFDKVMRIRPINELCRIAKMVSKVLLCFVATLY
jgi:hypothetical protein